MVSLRTLPPEKPSEATRPQRNNYHPATKFEGVFEGYRRRGSYSEAFDEMFDSHGNVRGPYKGIYAELAPSDASELAARNEALGRAFINQGITFSLSGEDRPFPLDMVPRVIPADEWSRLERGVRQRVRALEAFLDDVYDRRSCATASSRASSSPPAPTSTARCTASNPPTASGSTSPASTWSATPQGTFRVLEDNVRVPSGVSATSWRTAGPWPRACPRPSPAASDPAGRGLPAPAAVARCARRRPPASTTPPWWC